MKNCNKALIVQINYDTVNDDAVRQNGRYTVAHKSTRTFIAEFSYVNIM